MHRVWHWPVAGHVATIRQHSKLPVAIAALGISNPAQARAAARAADAVVVGSAIVNQIASWATTAGSPKGRAVCCGDGRRSEIGLNRETDYSNSSNARGPDGGEAANASKPPRPTCNRVLFCPPGRASFFNSTVAKALVWYQIYGHFSDTIDISRGKYRCTAFRRALKLGIMRARIAKSWISFATQPLLAARLHDALLNLSGRRNRS